MAGGRSLGGRNVVGDEGGDTARGSDLALVGEYLPALRPRPVGAPMAREAGVRGRDPDTLCRRFRHGVSAPGGSGAIPGSTGEALAKVRAGIAPGEDAPDRVWALCRQ